MSALTRKSDTVPERYIHFRIERNPRIHHATVFMRKSTTDLWVASVAFCNVEDQFDRAIGRKVARRRYFSPARSENATFVQSGFNYENAACEVAHLADRIAGVYTSLARPLRSI